MTRTWSAGVISGVCPGTCPTGRLARARAAPTPPAPCDVSETSAPKISESWSASVAASACVSLMTASSSLYVSTSIDEIRSRMRVMFDAESLRITVLVGG